MHICTALLVHALVHALSFALVITLIASPAPPCLACLSRRIASLHWLKHSCASHAQCVHAHAHMHCLVGACSRACSELRSGHYTNRLARSASPCTSFAPHRLASLAETFMCITTCTYALPCWQCSSCTVPLLHACSFMCITCTVRACTCTYAPPRWQCSLCTVPLLHAWLLIHVHHMHCV
jgi:hypothetical protein